MATAVSKPSYPPKVKRPPPPFSQPSSNGVRRQPASSSPQSASKRLPDSAPINGSAHGANDTKNPAIKGPLGRPRRDAQRLGDQPLRLQKPLTRNTSVDNGRRSGKIGPEPYVKTTSYILGKYSKSPPSLIVHLHPTHFRFEQQDGSFPYNSEMKVIIEHIRAGTVPQDMIEELLRAGVRFYEGCLIVRVVDHKSASAQARKSLASSSNEHNTPFSIHNYNEHVTPSAYVPYPKQSQFPASSLSEEASNQPDSKSGPGKDSETSGQKIDTLKPRVFTTVLHPTPRSLQAELTLLATTPDRRATKQSSPNTVPHGMSLAASTNQADRGHPAKRQKMLVEPQDLIECESKLTRALAPPLFLDPVGSLEAVQDLLKFLESPLHRDVPPSPKRRKRTIAELAADEALAAEEERFMLIMDERLEASGTAGGSKSGVDEAGGVAPFEPRFSRFKTLENIRMQHDEKAKREHEIKLKQEMAKRQQQEQERERRRALEQRQADENAKEEARRQQLAAQQAHLAAQQQQNRLAMNQANGVSQGQQSSPVMRNQTPHNISSPLVGNTMATQAGVPMSMTSSAQGGSPPRPPSALQHAHPNMMNHPMGPSRSQQGQSRHGTPQMTHGTPAVSHATPIMRNVTPTQRMGHASPNHTMSQTPVMNQAMMGTPQMGGAMGLTPQQQMLIQQRQQQLLAQHGQLGHGQFTPQQLAQIQANMHAQQNIQSQQQQQQQHMLQQAQQNNQAQQNKMPNAQAYQAQLMRAQLAQAQAQNQQLPQGQQTQGSPQMTPQQQQQQQMMMAAVAAQQNNGGPMRNFQGGNLTQRQYQLYQSRLMRLRQEMAQRLMPQYGPPPQYPPHIAHQYQVGLDRSAKAWLMEGILREQESAQQRASQVAAVQAQVMQQQNMMQNGMK